MSISKSVYVVTLLAIGCTVSCSLWLVGPPDRHPAIENNGNTSPCRCGSSGCAEVRWIELDDESARQELEDWCHTVGPVVTVKNTEPTNAPAVDSLAFVSWNTHVGGGNLVGFVRDLRAGVFTEGRRPDHFVLLLQEVFRAGPDVPMTSPEIFSPKKVEVAPPAGRRIDIVEVAETLKLNLLYVPSMRNGRPGPGGLAEDRGNAILSTLPLIDLAAIELPLERFRRVAAAATVCGRDPSGGVWNLRVCTAHFDTRTRFPRFFESVGAARKRQAEVLIGSLPETPAVLGGDLNTWALESLEGSLELIGDRFQHPKHPDESPTFELRLLPDRRLDHLFFDLPEGFTAHYQRLDDRYGSDHYPLLGFIQLTSNR
ncbi:MAG: hypothetical protein JSW58_03150 [Candidatus Latescibacterota bacterium]|nr:MAG: hypothetical protein JSW58_03150 [Candidatus Latescibacterota bacterium]